MIYTVISEVSDGYEGVHRHVQMVTTDKDKAINHAREIMGKGNVYDSIEVESWENETEQKEVFDIWVYGYGINKTIRERMY